MQCPVVKVTSTLDAVAVRCKLAASQCPQCSLFICAVMSDADGMSQEQDAAALFSEEQQMWIRELLNKQLPRAPSSSGSLAPSATSAAGLFCCRYVNQSLVLGGGQW